MSKMFTALFFLTLLISPRANAKDIPFQTVDWPGSGQATIRFTFSKFKLLVGGVGKEHGYVTDTTAENLTDKTIGSLNLALYVFDKSNARIGDASINLANVGAGQTVKFEITLYATGVPASVALASTAPHLLSMTVNSVPQGATLRLDGTEVGTTPKIIEVAEGKHMLDFSKEGFNTGHFPLEMGPHDTSGGSVSYELGTNAKDTIELRDGSVLSGDLISISGMQVQLRIAGATQTFDRNQVKRILLTQRDPADK